MSELYYVTLSTPAHFGIGETIEAALYDAMNRAGLEGFKAMKDMADWTVNGCDQYTCLQEDRDAVLLMGDDAERTLLFMEVAGTHEEGAYFMLHGMGFEDTMEALLGALDTALGSDLD